VTDQTDSVKLLEAGRRGQWGDAALLRSDTAVPFGHRCSIRTPLRRTPPFPPDTSATAINARRSVLACFDERPNRAAYGARHSNLAQGGVARWCDRLAGSMNSSPLSAECA